MKDRNRGFTLLEVLVALLVLSIGLLGLAGLQLTSVTNTRDSLYRTQAIALAYDIADRMRANIDAVYNKDDNHFYDGNEGTVTNADCRNKDKGCTPQEMANDDLALWRIALQSLPAGEGIVCRDDTPNDGTSVATSGCTSTDNHPYVVKIWWNNDRDANNANERLSMVFVP